MLNKEHITSFFRSKKQPESRFDQWDAAAYIKLAALSEYRSHDALTTLLTANFISFAAEYTRGEVVSTFEMDVDPVNGLLGMMKSYATGLLGMGENFEEKLEKQKKSPNRAQLETNNMIALDTWSVSAPIGELFIWNSPPGLVSEGYAGLNSHSFIFVYEKVSATKVVLHQYRTWMDLSHHQDFQNFATHTTAHTQTETPHSHNIIHTICIVSPKDHNCENSQELLNILEKKAYESQESWKVKPNEMPHIPEAEYTAFRDFLLSLYIRIVVPLLLAEVPQVSSETDPEWHAFIHTQKYKTLIKKLDLAFGILAYQPLLKWVEAADTNKNKKISFWKRLHTTKNSQPRITSLSKQEIEEGLLTMYQLQVDALEGGRIKKEDAVNYNSLASSLLSTTSKGLSLGQCGLGTFIPTKLASQFRIQTPVAGIPATPGMLGGLEPKQKSEVLSHLNGLEYTPLTLPNGETWYIKSKHFLEYKTFFKNTSLKLSEDGIPIGPCGWALRGDPRGNDDLVLTSAEYTELQVLKAQLMLDLKNNPEEGFDFFSTQLLELSTETEKEDVKELITLLKQALKKSIGISELLFNEFFDYFLLISHPLLVTLSKKVALSQFVLHPEKVASEAITVFRSEKHRAKKSPALA